MEKQMPTGEMRFIVKMNWFNSSVPCGTVSYLSFDGNDFKHILFVGMTDLLFKLDEVCDREHHPQRDTILRTRQKAPLEAESITPAVPEVSECGHCVTFELAVCMRQHSSMQGFIRLGSMKCFYRSEMELMCFLRDIMLCKGQKPKMKFQKHMAAK